jgi:hypothetical protein
LSNSVCSLLSMCIAVECFTLWQWAHLTDCLQSFIKWLFVLGCPTLKILYIRSKNVVLNVLDTSPHQNSSLLLFPISPTAMHIERREQTEFDNKRTSTNTMEPQRSQGGENSRGDNQHVIVNCTSLWFHGSFLLENRSCKGVSLRQTWESCHYICYFRRAQQQNFGVFWTRGPTRCG